MLLVTIDDETGIANGILLRGRYQHRMPDEMRSSNERVGIRRRSIANPGYCVKIFPTPIAIKENGNPVPDAVIVAIRFPRAWTRTARRQVPVVIGPGTAKILVGDCTIRDVPLC